MIKPTENTEDVVLIPFLSVHGVWTINDNTLVDTFRRMIDQRLVRKVFIDGRVQRLEDFMALIKSPHIYPVFAAVDDKIMGFAWMNAIINNHASCHFCMLKESWGPLAEKIGKEIVSYWFKFPGRDPNSYLFDILLGLTPATNKPALNYIQKVGFKVAGSIPKMCYDSYKDERLPGVISYAERGSH